MEWRKRPMVQQLGMIRVFDVENLVLMTWISLNKDSLKIDILFQCLQIWSNFNFLG